MQQGKIAKLIDGKGFGFIAADGYEKDLFFHASEMQNIDFDSLEEGDEVEFSVQDTAKGPQATTVSKL